MMCRRRKYKSSAPRRVKVSSNSCDIPEVCVCAEVAGFSLMDRFACSQAASSAAPRWSMPQRGRATFFPWARPFLARAKKAARLASYAPLRPEVVRRSTP